MPELELRFLKMASLFSEMEVKLSLGSILVLQHQPVNIAAIHDIKHGLITISFNLAVPVVLMGAEVKVGFFAAPEASDLRDSDVTQFKAFLLNRS